MRIKTAKMTAKMNAELSGVKPDTVEKMRAGKRPAKKAKLVDDLYAMVIPAVHQAIKEAVNKM